MSPIPGINFFWVTDIPGRDDKDTQFSSFVTNIDVEYCDVLGTKEAPDMPEIPGFKYTAELVCHDTIYITDSLIPYGECNKSDKLTTCNKINDNIVVVNAIDNAVNDYYQ